MQFMLDRLLFIIKTNSYKIWKVMPQWWTSNTGRRNNYRFIPHPLYFVSVLKLKPWRCKLSSFENWQLRIFNFYFLLCRWSTRFFDSDVLTFSETWLTDIVQLYSSFHYTIDILNIKNQLWDLLNISNKKFFSSNLQ